MIEKENLQNGELEIDLKRLLDAVLQQGWLIGLVSVLCAVLVFAGTFFFVAPKYESSAVFYVNNNSLSVGDCRIISVNKNCGRASNKALPQFSLYYSSKSSLSTIAHRR